MNEYSKAFFSSPPTVGSSYNHAVTGDELKCPLSRVGGSRREKQNNLEPHEQKAGGGPGDGYAEHKPMSCNSLQSAAEGKDPIVQPSNRGRTLSAFRRKRVQLVRPVRVPPAKLLHIAL